MTFDSYHLLERAFCSIKLPDMTIETVKTLIFLCGIGHIVLCFVSAIIPKVLNWKEHLKDVQPLIRQMFWTYAAYILVINFCFGVVSVLGTEELVNGSFLAKCINLFIAVYWFARVLIQFFYFDKSEAPEGLMFTLGEIALVGLFIGFTLVYSCAFYYNF
ncbi:MAG: hypothetical protein MK207_15050 [Saprospiraceae bacterium]|nr:hypothetical protein [Saprospiraceae bacterium]